MIITLAVWGILFLLPGLKASHTGPALAGLCSLAGAIDAVMFASWWQVAIGFGLTWVVHGICRAPSRQGPPVHEAVIADDPHGAARLLAESADSHATNHQGQTPLDLAVALNYTEMEQLLRSNAASARDPNRNTPLHFARDGKIAAMPIEHGKDLTSLKKSSSSANAVVHFKCGKREFEVRDALENLKGISAG